MAREPWLEGKVRWFDDLRGEGLVRSDDGDSYYFHYSSIENEKKMKSLRKSSKVKFKLVRDSHFTQVHIIKEK